MVIVVATIIHRRQAQPCGCRLRNTEHRHRTDSFYPSSRIILYAITGCVSVLFAIVIMLGVRTTLSSSHLPPGSFSSPTSSTVQAIRAFRHPERYGPRTGFSRYPGEYPSASDGPDAVLPPQSRAAGLGRAVLDSFPLVKFGQNTNALPAYPTYDEPESGTKADIENGPGLPRRDSDTSKVEGVHSDSYELAALPAHAPQLDARRQSHASTSSAPPSDDIADQYGADSHHESPPRSRTSAQATGADLPDPAAIGRETCPICIADFEVGDDVRVLPCEGHHKFHQACVDPWLLELSSSCPICRAGTYLSSCLFPSKPYSYVLIPLRRLWSTP